MRTIIIIHKFHLSFARLFFVPLVILSQCGPAASAGLARSAPDFSGSLHLNLKSGEIPDIPLPPVNPGAPAFPLVYARSTGKITVGINPNRELLYTMLQLTGFSAQLRSGREEPLVAVVLKEFAPFAAHPAVADLDSGGRLNWRQGLAYDAFSSFPGYFSALPEGRRLYPYDEVFLARVLPGMTTEQKVSYLDAYWEKAMDFYRVSGFSGFFQKNAAVYQTYVDNVYRNLPGTDPVALHEGYHAYYGYDNFYVVPSPLNLPTGGNYGWRLGRSIFNFMGYGFNDAEAVNHLILHEFGHSFCNPVVEKNADGLSAYSGLMAGVKEEMSAQAYGNWLTVMRELLVRSVHARLLLRSEGEQAAERLLLRDAYNLKFVFIRDFYDLLAVYEADRAAYPTLYEFYPKLMESLKNWELAEVEEAVSPGVWSSLREGSLVVTGVSSTGYGYAAGLRWGDTITAADGEKPGAGFFFALAPGRVYELSVTRQDGSQASIKLAVQSQKKLRPVKK